MRPCAPLTLVVLAAMAAAAAAPGSAGAADSRDQYRLRGLGAFTCARYLEDRAGDPGGSEAYAHWFTGYLTAYNYFEPQTFDIAPNHNAQSLLTYLDLYCAQNPGVLIGVAAQKFVTSAAVHDSRQISGD